MDLSLLLRLLGAAGLALAGLFHAAHGELGLSLSADQLGLLVFLAGLLLAYRLVKAHWDAREGR